MWKAGEAKAIGAAAFLHIFFVVGEKRVRKRKREIVSRVRNKY